MAGLTTPCIRIRSSVATSATGGRHATPAAVRTTTCVSWQASRRCRSASSAGMASRPWPDLPKCPCRFAGNRNAVPRTPTRGYASKHGYKSKVASRASSCTRCCPSFPSAACHGFRNPVRATCSWTWKEIHSSVWAVSNTCSATPSGTRMVERHIEPTGRSMRSRRRPRSNC